MSSSLSRRVGRPPTGRTTKVVRIPLDYDPQLLIDFYQSIAPLLSEARQSVLENPSSPRYHHLSAFVSKIDPHLIP
jgi:hypothetical protein